MAIALVNGAAAGAFAADTVNTAALNMTGVDLLVILAAYGINSGTTSPSCTDSEGNTYTLGAISGAANNAAAKMAYAAGPPTVSASMFGTVTVDGSLLAKPAIGWLAFSGLDPAPADVESSGSGTGAQSVQVMSAFTPSVNGCLIVSMIAIDRTVTNMTLTGGGLTWTLLNGTSAWVGFSSGNHPALFAGFAVQTTAAEISDLTWDWTTNAQRTCKAWVFKPAAGAGGNPWYSYAQQRVATVLAQGRHWSRRGLLWTPSYAHGKAA